jgi:NAD(P)-dependent dehydrogenase (short-subunit alcohol dehydrogenase family)
MAAAPSPVALVTGSNRGIGPEIVRTLQGAGYAVVSNGRSATKGPGDVHVRADAASRAGARKLVAAARKLGGLDLLVCGVGDFLETPVAKMQIEAWERLFESNLKTAWVCCREALPLLRRRRGSIVTIGGTVTQNVRANPRYVAYQMAKTALTVFTKSLARAEAPRGVRVNMVNPGFIRTYNYAESELPALTKRVPAGRLGDPKDVAEAVVWLASDSAGYVNGAVLDVGGGLWA